MAKNMNKLIKQIPNLITSGNLLCGSFSVVASFSGRLDIAALLIILGAVFDFFDGMVARLLKASGPIGLQLDSLADMVSFGLAPAVIIFEMLQNSSPSTTIQIAGIPLIAYFAFIHVPFAAYRLAKFNVDTRQHTSFIGLPTPASALVLLSFPLIVKYEALRFPHLVLTFTNTWFLLITTFILSLLMVSELPLFSLKFKKGDKDNIVRIIFLIVAVVLLGFFHFLAIPVIILIYIIVSLFRYKKEK
ncbi:MAG: CDP-diacylglycerol--serine O-phosphatidyltransferase [Bacteroidales bacterium]